MAAPLNRLHCRPARKKGALLTTAKRRALREQIPKWRMGETTLSRSWRLQNFDDVFRVVRKIAALAKDEDHHPDIHMEDYRKLRIVLTTHAAGGLTLNDFILAARIDAIAT